MSAGAGLEASGNLDVALFADACAGVQAAVSDLRRLLIPPQTIRVPSVTLIGSAGTVSADMTGPAGGLYWELRRLTIAPPQAQPAAVTTPGTFVVYIDGEEITRTTTVPNMIQFGRAAAPLRYPSKMSVAWIAGTAGVPLVVGASVIQVSTSRDYEI